MNNPRLVYRVILKFLGLIAFIVLLWVLTRSLFINSSENYSQKEAQKSKVSVMISLDIAGMIEGEIRKAQWQGKEVAILYRKAPITDHKKYTDKLTHLSLNIVSRSLTPEYFVYINKGNSGNCPLFYTNDTLKDICSSTVFNSAGREKNNLQQGFKLIVPPHYFKEHNLIIGEWPIN